MGKKALTHGCVSYCCSLVLCRSAKDSDGLQDHNRATVQQCPHLSQETGEPDRVQA